MFLPMSWTSPFTVASSILPRRRQAEAFFLFFHEGQQLGDGLLHHPRALDDLGQEHLARAEQVADDLHAVHQRPFDDLDRSLVPLATSRLFTSSSTMKSTMP